MTHNASYFPDAVPGAGGSIGGGGGAGSGGYRERYASGSGGGDWIRDRDYVDYRHGEYERRPPPPSGAS